MWRIIDIGNSSYYLHSKDNKLVISKDNAKLEDVPYQDISTIILHSENIVLSGSVLQNCADFNIPIIMCDEKQNPAGIFINPFLENKFGPLQKKQFEMMLPKRKQLWKKIIQSKLTAQSVCLEKIGKLQESKEIGFLISQVLSGDSDNREAVGAKLYFPALFDINFSRKNDDFIENGFLNYGYTILRSLVCRSIVSSGLNPSLSLFHSNRVNQFALSDDLMEPLRPVIDLKVLTMLANGFCELNSAAKKEIIGIISQPVFFSGRREELKNAINFYVSSYTKVVSTGDVNYLEIPRIL